MKARLLKKIRRRFQLIGNGNEYSLIDIRKKNVVDCEQLSWAYSKMSMYQLYIREMIIRTIGEAGYKQLSEERSKNRYKRREQRRFNLLIKPGGSLHQQPAHRNLMYWLGIVIPSKEYHVGYGQAIVTKTKINWINPLAYPAVLFLFVYAAFFRLFKSRWPWDVL